MFGNKEVDNLNVLVDKMARLGTFMDLTMSVVVTRLKNYSMDLVAVKALMEALSMDDKLISKELWVVRMLKIMSRYPKWSSLHLM